MPKLPSFLAVICYQMTIVRNTILEDGVIRRDFLTLVPSAFLSEPGREGADRDGVQLAQGADPPGLSWHRELHQSTDKSLDSGRAPFLSTCPQSGQVALLVPIATEVSPGLVSKEC
ncbi:unnamed protein product [Pipistrellus nathusii]|uniref:Uncharacterized protein n=1 Tax=Pipistrellus nathusii TaxID=59473 RepID=A0ABP0AC63_PIPNA